MEREAITLRMDERLYKRVMCMCESEGERLSDIIREAAKRIIKRYKFDRAGLFIGPR